MKQLRIIILDGHVRQTLPFLKSLRQKGHLVTVACTRRISPGGLSRYAHRRILVPDCETQPKQFLQALLAELKSREYDIILPFGHHTIKLCIEHKQQIQQYATVPVPDYTPFMRTLNKGQTMAFCMENAIPCPYTYFPDKESIESIIERATFPLWLKPTIGVGAIGQRRLDTPDDLRQAYPIHKEKFGPMIVQEYIPHEGSQQFVCHTFLNKHSKMTACMVSEKPRFFPITGGTSTVLVSVDRPDISAYCKRLFEGIGMIGIGDADLIVDPRDGLPKVMEINPRVSCSIKIGFVTGIDYADMWVRLALDLPIEPHLQYQKGLHLRNLCQDILWYLYSDPQVRKTTGPPFSNFLGKNVFYQTISPDDPLTFVGFILYILRKYRSHSTRADKLGTI